MEVGLGTSQLRSLGRRAPVPAVRALLEAAVEAGVRYVDTADTYGAGSAERALAAAARGGGLGSALRVITKIGYRTPDMPGPLRVLDQPAKKVVQRIRAQAFDEASLSKAWAASRRRLGSLDVHACCLHNPPGDVLRRGDALRRLLELRASGGFRLAGVSVDDEGTARLLPGLSDVGLVEMPARIWVDMDRAVRDDLVERGVEVVVNRVTALDPQPEAALARLAGDPVPPTVAVVGTRSPVHLAADARAVRR